MTNQISRSEVQKFCAEHRGVYKVAAANLANGGGLTAASALTIRQELRVDGTC